MISCFVARPTIFILSTTLQHQLGLDSDVRLSRGGSDLLKILADTVYMKSLHVIQDIKIEDTLLKKYIQKIIQEEIKKQRK